MKSIKLLLATALMCLGVFAEAQNISIQSPQKLIQLKISQLPTGEINYSFNRQNKAVVLPSTFGFVLSSPDVKLKQFNIIQIDSSEINETWQPVWGELKNVTNHCKQLALTLADKNKSGVILKVVFRVFDDGVGFRYEFPQQKALDYFIVKDELTQFKLTGNHKAFWIPGDYDSNEFRYNTTSLSNVDAYKAEKEENAISTVTAFNQNAVQTPLMLKSNDGLYINIHEAALVNYPAMQLVIDKKTFTLNAHLVPDPVGNKAYLHAPSVTPWRTIIVSDKATEILASKIIINLNEPSKIKDPSFIKPQKFMGVWWEMFNGKASWDTASGKHGATTANVKKYIDFASKHGIDGLLVEGWNVGWEDWFGKWKENVFDFITPYKDFDIDELTAYAKSKNVKIIAHHETSGSATNYERQMDTAFRFMLNHNQNSVKTGYVGKIIPRGEHHDGQWMVNHYVRVVEKAAKYGIMIDAHEPVRPTGLYRTYPNWLACEAGRGTEFNAFTLIGNPPEHETIMPFTRWMGGPMDYTPGIFKQKLTQFDANKKEMVHTTLAKQLAFYVVIFSPIQMAADMPENYEAHLDAFQFIKDVAINWDDTKILEAEPGDYVTIARKAKDKNDWFVGGVTDENGRIATVNLNFLDANSQYEATIYKDADNAHYDTNPEVYTIEKQTVNSTTILKIKEAPGGGFAIKLRKL